MGEGVQHETSGFYYQALPSSLFDARGNFSTLPKRVREQQETLIIRVAYTAEGLKRSGTFLKLYRLASRPGSSAMLAMLALVDFKSLIYVIFLLADARLFSDTNRR
ncbi:hypothetical protein GOODEAATRI_026362 [Goodea atripinnis]|uniref:Uncharacterized protein n=1 Tax=Goodea atripinnis TaxID=208336 RepID=A0ABV0Q197_9TELE